MLPRFDCSTRHNPYSQRRSPPRLLCSLYRIVGFVSSFPIAAAFAADLVAPLAWHGASDIAIGRGERGPWQQNESRYDYVDDPTVAIDQHGDIAVAWVDQARKDVLFQRYAADGTPRTRAPLNVSGSPATFSWLPRIAVTPQKVYLLWQEIIFSGGSHGGDILFARSEDNGTSFAAPVNLSNSVGGDGKGRINRDVWHNGSFDLVASADGKLYAAWTEYDGPLWFSRSTDGGKTFSRPARIADVDPAKPARGPTLALGADGTLYVAWTVGEDQAADIRVAKSTDGGATFSAPQMLAPSSGYSDAPKLAVDPRGVLHVVYAESAGGPFERSHVRYTRSTDGARTFAPAREISQHDATPRAAAGFPALCIDANGNLYVIWERYPERGARPRGLGLTVSRDGGQTFTPPLVVPGSSDPGGGSNGSHQGLLMEKLAVNDTGAVAIVNSSLKQNARSRVWLMRGRLALPKYQAGGADRPVRASR
jgi:hypothetical protein